MPTYVTKQEFVAYKAIIDDQIEAITKQIAMLIQRNPSVEIDQQMISVVATFDNKIQAINAQLLVLRGSIKDVKTAEIDGLKYTVQEALSAASVQILKLQSDVDHLKAL